MSPFRAGEHTIDRMAQIDACTHCHLPPVAARAAGPP